MRNKWIVNVIEVLKKGDRDFHACPLAKTVCFGCSGPGSIPGQGTRPHMPQLRPGAAK